MKILLISIICLLIVEGEFWQVPKQLQSLAWFRMAKTQKPAEQNSSPQSFIRNDVVSSTSLPIRNSHNDVADIVTELTVSSTIANTSTISREDQHALEDIQQRQLQIHLSPNVNNFTENATIENSQVEEKEQKSSQSIEDLKPLNKEDTAALPDSSSLVKPTKYHYYPHNQHIYVLPECAVQQVCNAVYLRLKTIQPLCACPFRYRNPCSASYNSDDLHTTELATNYNTEAKTLVKTCEAVSDIRTCKVPEDWSILALQDIRTGKSKYLVVCRCPETKTLEGPFRQEQTVYTRIPGVRVYGMKCVQGKYSAKEKMAESKSRNIKSNSTLDHLEFHWPKINEI